MAKQQENSQEPSIEEILDSIRQIISDDEDDAASAPPPAPVEEEPIELTERVPERENIQVDMKEPDPVPEPEPVIAAPPPPPPPPPAPPKPEPKPEPVQARPEPAPAPQPAAPSGDDFNSILTKNAEDSVMGAFTELTKRAAINKINEITVEDIVREELRPMLKTWLDKNLPELVEKLLQKELDRISKRVIGDD